MRFLNIQQMFLNLQRKFFRVPKLLKTYKRFNINAASICCFIGCYLSNFSIYIYIYIIIFFAIAKFMIGDKQTYCRTLPHIVSKNKQSNQMCGIYAKRT